MTRSEQRTIPAPEGSLEALVAAGGAHDGPALLLCHPHPQYGGSLDDAVLEAIATAWASRVSRSLRFNFRGVGASSGRYDGGRGEVADVEAAAAWLGVGPLWLGGYSFGSAMAWQALRTLAPERVLLVAPPIGAMAYPERPALAARVDVVVGDRDQFVDREAVERWATTAAQDVHVHVIAGADHFFMGRHDALDRVLRSTV